MLRPFMKKPAGMLATLCLIIFGLSWKAGSGWGDMTFKPSQVKAAFIYNLAYFVNWPKSYVCKDSGTFVIAVLGNDEIAHDLKILTQNEKVLGCNIRVKAYASQSEIDACRILFVSRSAQTDLKKLLTHAAESGILTVGDWDTFIRQGGMVGLIRKGKRIHLEINIEAARSAGIRFNAKLLKLADIIRTSGP